MIDQAIQSLARKNSDELVIEIKQQINNESDFNMYVKVLNKDKPSYLTWSNVQTEEGLLDQQKIDKENNKTSGKAKLKSGDALTDAEIDALFG
jgi:hypothetical protein|tara:strand:+ start:1071 stop:1349 length:279 start_codon:yes stop_codon:yes gene_type:complete